ncbi:MAG TPA: hypothetical protein VLB44_00330, partial [Kofleriaceae bacterium]|nr:hypothetical protein [Kofleriaceae bacterium]
STASALSLGPGLDVLGVHSLGALLDGDPPLVRAGGGGLVAVGVRAGVPMAEALDDDGAPTGVSRSMAGAEQPGFPTAIPLDEGFAAVWQAGSGAVCRLITVHADLSIAAGPVSMSTTACAQPQIAWLPGAQRFVVAADDPNTGRVIAGVFTASLVQVVPTFAVTPAGYGAQIVDDGDGAWIAWVRTSDAALGYARITADGGITPAASALGHLDTVNMHYHVLQHVAGSAVALWGDVDQSFSLAAARLCR